MSSKYLARAANRGSAVWYRRGLDIGSIAMTCLAVVSTIRAATPRSCPSWRRGHATGVDAALPSGKMVIGVVAGVALRFSSLGTKLSISMVVIASIWGPPPAHSLIDLDIAPLLSS